MTSLLREDSKDIIAARWYEATEQFQSYLRRLSTSEYINTHQLQSYISLLEGLRQATDVPSQNWAIDVEVDIRPALEAVQAICTLFTDFMFPHVLDINPVWSMLFVAIKVSLKSQQKWTDFVDKLNKTRYSLMILYHHAAWFKDKDESYDFVDAICNSLVRLSDCWIEVIKWCRQSPDDRVARESWTKVHEKYEKALGDIEKGNAYLSNVITLKQKPRAYSRESELRADLLNRLHISGDTTDFPLNTLPYPEYRGFYGREDILTQLKNALLPAQSSRGLQSVLLHGLGGVGKSQTALAFAHRYSRSFDATFWVRTETETSMKDSFTSIALALHLVEGRGEGQEEEHLLYFQAWLRKQAADKLGRKWLLIFDNCGNIGDIPSKYIPTTEGSILITSRSPLAHLRDSSLIHVQPLLEHEGVGLLKQLIQPRIYTICSTKDDEPLSRLVNKVGGLPLGLQVIAGLVNAWGLPVSKFCDLYNQNERDLMTNFGRVIDYDHDITRVVGEDHVLDNVWKMSFQKLGSDSKALLGMMCLLSPDQIPTSLFELNKSGKPLMPLLSVCTTSFRLYDAVRVLREAALVTSSAKSIQSHWLGNGMMLDVHRLIQEAVIYIVRENYSEYFTAVIFLLFNMFDQIWLDDVLEEDEWQVCSQLLSHVFSMLHRYKAFRAASSDTPMPPLLLDLLWRVTWYLYDLSSYTDALNLLAFAEEICKDKTTTIYAQLLNVRACIYLDMNDLASCKILQAQVVQLENTGFDARDPIYRGLRVRQLHNSANLACAEGNWDTAIENYKSSHAIKETLLNFGIKAHGRAHLCLGRAYYFKGEWGNAREEYGLAARYFEQDPRRLSAWMAHLKYAVGNLENAIGDVEKAKENYIQSQLLWEQVAPFHIALTGSLYKLAILAGNASNNDLALEYINQGLAIARFKKSKRDEARLLRKQAWVYKLRANVSKSMESLLLARELREELQGHKMETAEDSDAVWDSLVSIFWR